MSRITPLFAPRDRCFSHYVGDWGTVESVDHVEPAGVHGVTGDPLPASTWYVVRMDSGRVERLDDASGDWELARLIPPAIASRYGYGQDPRA